MMRANDVVADAVAVDAMNAWSERVVAHLEMSDPNLLEALRSRLFALGSFSSAVYPQVVHSLPVLYMFSGSDLLTAHALFPHAPSYHLVADFPTGHPTCFVDAACAAKANESASAFFRHWANLRCARQSTNLMRRAFVSSGQLPALLLSLRLMGQPVVHATLHADNIQLSNGTAPLAARGGKGGISLGGKGGILSRAGAVLPKRSAAGGGGGGGGGPSNTLTLPTVTIHTPRFRVSYTSMLLRSDPSEHVQLTKQFWPNMGRWTRGGPFIDAQLSALSDAIGASKERRLFVSMFKAAPHWILRNDWAAKWVMERSYATLHDETGLRPHFYNGSTSLAGPHWTTRVFGAFRDFENREVKWYANEKSELQRLFHDEGSLPFQFGYAQSGGHGVLLAAWRTQTV